MTDGARTATRTGSGPAQAATHCPYCALQCGMVLRATGDGVEVGARDFPTNRGGLCQKGWTAADLLDHPDRLTTPLLRDRPGGELRPATWDEALDRIAAGVRDVQQRHGPHAVAVFGGGGLTNEKAYALGRFARVTLRTRHIDYNGRWCMSSAAAAGNRAFGIDRGLPFPLADLGRADTLLLVGANPAETMPPLMRHVTDLRERGGRLIVVDPRATATARQADLHLQPLPGTDLAVANALLHIALTEGWLDRAYVAERTTGFDEVRRTVAGYWPAEVERLSGVPVADLYATARALATVDRAIILTARGAEQHAKGVDTVTALINLALALGLPGRPGSGYGCLTGQGNGQGGREHGQKADQLPGYRRIDDPAARAHVAGVWGVDPDSLPGPGVPAYQLLDALGTPSGARALLVFGSNPVVSAPRAARVESRLRALDLLVVADFVRSETAELADVVLPVAQWAEENGTMTNLEGRVLRRRALREPPAGVRTELEILAALAGRLTDGAPLPSDPREVFAELGRASAGGPADYAGITWDRIDADTGVFWPCPDRDGPDTPRLFADRFPTPDGRARFHAVTHRPAAEPVCADYPLHFTTGRVLAQYQSGAQTRRVAALRRAAPGGFVELHPDLAARLGVTEGAPVRVVSRRGELRAPARLSTAIRPDTVFAPFHWPGAQRANSVTNDALDPVSGMPEFKICAVRVEPA
ncbi:MULTISPECIES: molybdopterin oxidoreductase family protein [Micromonospora]|uniref:Nitrite reductase n=2 Tax=Micromonospora TaxID=1873 RepID=A0ABX9Y2I2_MICCH|nr:MULTISPECIES: molybdopterin oxidoreductase family protein [Micromonospora]MCK1807505.1 molybdopterin oxidoreductase family protein [Micromonospora sp. R42106]MCK1833879.1 molybdopterin oxidoreductase family protein [Micromonospora sp. R42003]MCK1845365.1 molybdopterin oxidoreductase family protein [Micromonospora sp. R42004]MCM1019328.1 molybdopterin oxidoreductase family protein [Micromonospora sp. XM-20-01]ODB79939.1 nitrite reductase [Micromonospora sp. II]